MKIKNIYFANGLFNESQLAFNENLASKVRSILNGGVELYLPQENMSINNKDDFADSVTIFNADNTYLDKSDLMIAVLDGDTIDDGVACEIGRASALGIPIIGIYTDTRQGNEYSINEDKVRALSQTGESQFPYINLYVIGAIKSNGIVVRSSNELIKVMEELSIIDSKSDNAFTVLETIKAIEGNLHE